MNGVLKRLQINTDLFLARWCGASLVKALLSPIKLRLPEVFEPFLHQHSSVTSHWVRLLN